jgi:hypothetical protein
MIWIGVIGVVLIAVVVGIIIWDTWRDMDE